MNHTDDDEIPTGEHLLQVEEARRKQENTVRGLASTLQGAALAISLIDPLTLATHEFPRMYSPVRAVQTPEEVEAALKDAAERRAKKNERRAQRHKK